ncbi:hypothetical protein AKJ09_05441 [Labilithrix luteola]|uniref:Uncharacterized protein n=1 Tax=Labilithrix luteola TaxID=1391654 RepID=A0A0K1PZ65_9BACT|nr:hypothetical protein AKJ09_05441 [Labilithrix luteola]
MDAGREATEPKGPATCSDAGWCVTTLPDSDLKMVDIWPFRDRAFAIASSPTLGVKVLEWVEADQRWSYIDDNTQNDDGFGKYVGRIWSPNENEIHFTISPGYVYHGRRAANWSWERTRLPVSAGNLSGDPALTSLEAPALGVWGTSADDVYAWHANTIFHWAIADGGKPDWIPEYVGDDQNYGVRVFILGAGGSSKDDVWFSGGRGNGNNASCALLVHKTQEGYRHVVDGTFSYGFPMGTCSARPDTLLPEKAGAMTDVQPAGAGRLVALRYPDTMARIASDGDGGFELSSTRFTASKPVGPSAVTLYSLWAHGDDAWFSGSGLVLRGPVSADADAFGVSTLALTGAPLDTELYRVRGTNDDNLWAIGARYALHKTTP